MKENIKKLECGNMLVVSYLFYVAFNVFTEWINFLFFLTSVKYVVGIAEVISFGICIFVFIKLLKDLDVKKLDANVEVIVGVIILLIMGVITSVYVDNGFDTYNYHLIAQNPKFRNYFVEDFGYGNFQVWGFRLPDRLFYYFRLIFGFRFGTILNSIVISISYVQIYNLLDCFLKDRVTLKNNIFCNKLIWSLVIVLQLDVLFMYGVYYVDVLSLPIALEIIRILLEEHKKEHNSINIVYFASLSGLWIAFKLTNVIYVVPCVIIYIWQHFKEFKIFDWFISVGCGIFSWLEYILYNWICTGNPVFPYFNTIFKSKYYPIENFKDARWGGQNLFEKLTWIFYAAFKSEYRQSEIYDEHTIVLMIGLLSLVCILFHSVLNKRGRAHNVQHEIITIGIIALSSAILWGVTTGYSRYFLFGKILFGILAFYIILKLVINNKIYTQIIAGILLVLVIYSSVVNVSSMLSGRNWSWTVYNDAESFCSATKELFKDHDITKENGKNVDLFVLTEQTSMGVAELMDSNVYALNTNYAELINPKFKDFIREKINGAKNACDIHKRDFSDIQEYVTKLNDIGVYIDNIENVSLGSGEYELVKVLNSTYSNEAWVSNMGNLEIDVTELEGKKTLCFTYGRIYAWEAAKKMVANVYIYNDDKRKLVKKINIDNTNIENVEIPVSIYSNSKVSIEFRYDDGTTIEAEENNNAFVLNWQFRE